MLWSNARPERVADAAEYRIRLWGCRMAVRQGADRSKPGMAHFVHLPPWWFLAPLGTASPEA